MKYTRLNSLMIIHVHKEHMNTLSTELSANEFVARREHILIMLECTMVYICMYICVI